MGYVRVSPALMLQSTAVASASGVTGMVLSDFTGTSSVVTLRLSVGVAIVPGVLGEAVFAAVMFGVAFACGWSAIQPADITRSAARIRKIPLRFMGIIVFISPGP
jgi:hypothetical protein